MAEGNGEHHASGIERFLVTGVDLVNLNAFLVEAMPVVDPIDFRGTTVFFATYGSNVEHLLRAARKTGATLQRARRRSEVPAGAPPEPYWEVIHQGEAAAWSPAADEPKGGGDAAAE